MSTTPPTPEITYPVDLTTEPYKTLAAQAARITALLQDPKVLGDEELLGSLDELIGSVYSLITARHLAYDDRVGKPKEYAPILKRAQQLSTGIVRTNGKWMAGYYMNSSTYRTASVYHRILKIMTGKTKGDIPTLEAIAKIQYETKWAVGEQWNASSLDKVRRESNDLKHTEEGLYPSRGLWYNEAVNAIGEALTMLEAYLPHK